MSVVSTLTFSLKNSLYFFACVPSIEPLKILIKGVRSFSTWLFESTPLFIAMNRISLSGNKTSV
ncbi:MAG: hypothetical protein ACLTA5_01990 [Anaerococcus obesiensis]